MNNVLAETEVRCLQIDKTAFCLQHSEQIEYNDGNLGPVAHPVFRNDVILRTLLSFANFETLKQCRQVNTTWKKISEPIFIKKIQVICSGRQTPKRFLSYLSDNEINLQCGRYKFYKTRLSLSNSLKIFEKDFLKLTSLTIVDTIMIDDSGKEISSCSLSNLLGGHLKKLIVSGPTRGSTKMVIPQERLFGLEHLELYSCSIDLKPDSNSIFRCSPKYIWLKCLSFQKGGHIPEEDIRLNKFLDISNAEEINIFSFQHPRKVRLHLEGPTEKSVDYVQLDGVVLTTSRDFKLKHLNIYDESFEIANLPLSLEKLSIYHNWNMEENFLLPNLKYLYCAMTKFFPLNLSLFSQCSNLSSVKLRGIMFSDQVECNLSLLPPSVETLVLININGKFEENQTTIRNLKLLVIFQCSEPFIYNVLKRFLADNIVIGPKNNDIRPKEHSLLCIQILQERLFRERFIFGGLYWEYDDFDCSGLQQIVDKESDCYYFKGTKGKAIGSFPFTKLLSGQNDALDVNNENEPYDVVMKIFNDND